MSGYWRDEDFQLHLVAFLCKDRNFLRDTAHLLEPDDFKPKPGEPSEIWLVASKALEFYEKYRQPISGMLRTEILDHCRKTHASDKAKNRLMLLVDEIKSNHKMVAVDALAEKVIEYKKDRLRRSTIQEILELQERGRLTDEKWTELCYGAIKEFGQLDYKTSNFFEELDDRTIRRIKTDNSKQRPYFLIDPLDDIIRGPGRGHLAIWMAYLGMGKSMALVWMALAYVLQGFNVLYITLEDPREEVEDRFDAAITHLPSRRLSMLPRKIKRRFKLFMRLVHSRMKIVDGTEGGMTVPHMEDIWERERNRGFTADAVIVDYDDEIVATKKQTERRFELADIYRDLRKFAARRQIFLWTAAQTTRKTEKMRVISSGQTAEDISKARKVRLAIGIGQGDWGEHSRYLYIAKNNFGRQFIGRNIIGNFSHGLLYDREATIEAQRADHEQKKKERVEGDDSDT